VVKELKQLIKNDEQRRKKLKEQGINYVYKGFVMHIIHYQSELLQQ
jgi:hypothetical protein